MSDVIKADAINFSYRVLTNHQSSLKTLFKDFVNRKVRVENYQALKDLSFSVTKGETVAIIGKNGAGKSTLLKLLAQVVPPTSGQLKVIGSVAPMIELGAGFNPELTGRENIIFYSALLGRDIKEVKTRVEAIAHWAGVIDHMDHQLRTFSSGMIARLAFSTATDQVPDLLLIDEVLSVGDGEFALKSKKRMQEIITSGTTVILVSHDLVTVAQLANRVIWLEKGAIKMVGNPIEVIAAYQLSGG
jgi:ABC-type polysaccharide/polyol phosphate transport system ATPase subunit